MPSINSITSQKLLLGSLVELTLAGPWPESRLHADAAKAFSLIESVHRLMNAKGPESDIFRINQCARLAPLRVHAWTWHVLESAVKLSAETQGAFDVTLAPTVVKWGNHPRHRDTVALGEAGRWEEVQFLDDHRVYLQGDFKIDLGVMARGFAVDKAIDFLSTRRLTRAMVSAGEEFRVCGLGPHALGTSAVEPLPTTLLRSAVATSPAFFVRKRLGVAKVSPVIHPHTGKALRANKTVSVFAPTCSEADALSKAVLLAPQPVWNRALQIHDSFALFITSRGEQVLFPA